MSVIVETLQAIEKKTGKVVWAVGIEDMHSSVQPIVASEYLVASDAKLVNRDLDLSQKYVNLGEQDAKDHCSDEFEKIEIKIVYINI